MDLSPYGEDGLRILFGPSINLEIHEKVRRFYFSVKALHLKEVVDIIPSFGSCLIRFDSRLTTCEALSALLSDKASTFSGIDLPPVATREIPVRYSGEDGPDMTFVMSQTGLSEEEVIDIHTAITYTVFAVGFLPGFPYLGTLDERLRVPRLETPRVRIPAGSVGIAQLQTGVYPFASPAGWQIIGRTDIKLFDPTRPPYSLLQIGDWVRFVKA